MSSENNVAAYLLRNKRADQVALLTPTCSYTYGDLESAVSRLSSHLRQLGCAKGDRIVVLGENSFFWVVAYIAVLAAGMVCVPLPADIPIEDLQLVLAETESSGALVETKLAAKIGSRLGRLHLITDRAAPNIDGVLSQTTFSGLAQSLQQQPLEDVHANDLAALVFTSGSTGQPHGVMVSHGNIIANTNSIVQYLGLTEADRIMTVLPFHYCFGASLLHSHLRVGGSLYLDSRFLYPERILQEMQSAKCTGFAGVPSHFQILLRKSSLRKKSFPHLRYVQQAGGQLSSVFIQELRQALPNTQIFIMYGQTEATARLSYLPPELLEKKLGSVGRGIPGVSLRVVDESGRDVRPGQIGEIVAQGENVALGYWKEPEESAARFRDGVLHTGDLATIDEGGFIFIVDRAQDFIKCGGKRIGCRQIEDRIQGFECLIETAVVGMPDDVLGEAVKAFVVPRMPDCSGFEDCFSKYCRQNIPPQLVPKEVGRLSSLPKNNAGKVLKSKLRGLRTSDPDQC
jgi:long-chain acyl-CoA synthetase